jgi:hypothetical protein
MPQDNIYSAASPPYGQWTWYNIDSLTNNPPTPCQSPLLSVGDCPSSPHSGLPVAPSILLSNSLMSNGDDESSDAPDAPDAPAAVPKPAELDAENRMITDFIHAFVDKAKNKKGKNKTDKTADDKWMTEYHRVAGAVWAVLTDAVVVTVPKAGAGKKHFTYNQLSCILDQGQYASVDALVAHYKGCSYDQMLAKMASRYYLVLPPQKQQDTVKAAMVRAGFKIEKRSKSYDRYYAARISKEFSTGMGMKEDQYELI